MTGYLQQVKAALRATIFHSPTTYSWFGKRIRQLPPGIKRAISPVIARSYLLFHLQSQLYTDFYCKGLASPGKQEITDLALPPVSATTYIEELSEANSGTGHWEESWAVRAIEDGKVVVIRGGLELRALPEDFLAPQGGRIMPGIQLSLRFPKEFLAISPGFYMALSNKGFRPEDSQSLVRLYWNLDAKGAVDFMRSVTAKLNHDNLPFRLKVLNNLRQSTRCDAVVLYICKSDYAVVSEILERIYPLIVTHLRPRTPAFTKLLAKGVGLAEDPGEGESFGLHRCRLLAEGMLLAHEQGCKSTDERLKVVNDHFTKHGFSLEKPYLNPGSFDGYSFEMQLPLSAHSCYVPKTQLHSNTRTDVFLQAAYDIGKHLSQEAIWHHDRCNWLGAESILEGSLSRPAEIAYKTLGPELYAGTSGMALFLAELYGIVQDDLLRHTALGAIRHAISRAGAVPSSVHIGLYTGWSGIAFAAARIGSLLETPELFQHAAQLLGQCARQPHDDREFDLISGSAGAIAALIILRDLLDDGSLLDFAARLGDRLSQSAEKSDAGYSWRSSAYPNQRNLTGFSHGAAGAGYALLELFHVTGDPKYYRTAELAFQYERHWFDSGAGNWPDFRTEPGHKYRRKLPLSFTTAWCHGAPGIALSRLRAYEILNDGACKAEAIIALQTTRKMVETTLQSETGNYSLCHGLAGNADVLLYGFQVLGDEWNDGDRLAHEVGIFGIETYTNGERQWPCGVIGGNTPNLMLGLAGIGYFYLRLHDPTIPSILILSRKS